MTEQAPFPRPRDRSRDFDVVLFGATGFTGKLVAEYLARNYAGSDLRWALAGRNRRKLEDVRAELARIDGSLSELPILIADSTDRESLDAIATRAEVICTTVGPYAKYGSELVAACVAAGTDYCDLTGEPQWIRRMVDRHHDAAERSGARIVHCCGFDSIPSDLGTLMVQDHAREKYGAPCGEVRYFAGKSRGGVSGGTVASMLNLLDEAKRDPEIRKVLGHPYSINPPGERKGPDGSDPKGMGRDPAVGFTAPFLMAAVNTRIVRRSNALSGYAYGRDFRYSERMCFGNKPSGALVAAGVTVGLAAFTMAALLPPTRALLERRVLPNAGEGPSKEQREAGFFVTHLIGTGRDRDGKRFEVRGLVEGTADPGYGETAKMLSESALCLALDGAELKARGGILTPAVAMGQRLIERLRKAGMTFEIE